jgi:hypothetical protein
MWSCFLSGCWGVDVQAQNTYPASDIGYLPLGEWRQITSQFGWRSNPFNGRGKEFHRGIDIDCQEGDSVFAWREGVVIYCGYHKLSGNMVNIAHADGFISKYHHLKKFFVRKGQKVGGGELIGLAGKSGRVTGAHLHFSILKNQQHQDPLPYIKKARRVTTPPPDQPKLISVYKLLAIRSYPIDGEVFIDGEHRGRTPLDVKLSYGEHFVEIDTGGKFLRFIGRLWIDQNSGHLYIAELQAPPK